MTGIGNTAAFCSKSRFSLSDAFLHTTLLALLFAALRFIGFVEWPMVFFFVVVFYALTGLWRGSIALRILRLGLLFGISVEYLCLFWVSLTGIGSGTQAPLNLIFPTTHLFIGLEAISPKGVILGQDTQEFSLPVVWIVIFLAPLVTGLVFAAMTLACWRLVGPKRAFREIAHRLGAFLSVTLVAITLFASLGGGFWLRWLYVQHPHLLSIALFSVFALPVILTMSPWPQHIEK